MHPAAYDVCALLLQNFKHILGYQKKLHLQVSLASRSTLEFTFSLTLEVTGPSAQCYAGRAPELAKRVVRLGHLTKDMKVEACSAVLGALRRARGQ